MKAGTSTTILVLGALVLFISGARGADLRVGVASVDITPPVGFRLSGYFRERVCTAVHDPLQAKAVVLAQGETKVALVICDLIGVPRTVCEPASQRIGSAIGTSPENVIVAATHTHTGPLYYGAMRSYMHEQALARHGGKDPCEPVDYAAFLVAELTRAAAKADAALRPAELFSGLGRQEPKLSFNRRYFMKDGSVRFNPGDQSQIDRPAGPIDPDVNVLLLREPTGGQGLGKALAGLTVFAMHLDTTGGTEYSADYPFYMEQTLRKRFGPDFISVFALGTCGNINHVDPFAKERRKAGDLGPLLAKSVEKIAASAGRVEPCDLAVRQVRVEVPLQHYPAERIAEAREKLPLIGTGRLQFLEEVEAYKIVDLQDRGATASLPVHAIRLGRELAIVTLPGEIFVELGLAIKAASPFKHTIVIELANDNPAYIPTKEGFKQGSYEAVNSRVAPGGGEMLVEAAGRLLEALRQR